MSFDPEQITFFAQTDARGQNTPFGIKAKDRTKHVYVIGKTGMGKSTLLENMAIQDIKNGNGLAFIDPHGQTAETLLDYVPESRKDDVLYFAPFDTDNPVSFNVMEDVGADRRHLVVSGLMSVFKKIWVDAWSARMEYILGNTLLALLEYPDSTLLGVNRMLSDKHYRAKVVDNIKDPSVRSFWVDEFANYNERYMQEAGDAIKNKIGQFTSNPLIRNIVGQPKSSFDIRQMMDEKKILIMNLSKGLVGESNANLLGSMLTTRIYLAAMSRADLNAAQMQAMPNFYFYVDEFQSFANATFANILSEARKYKLNLTIAHQYIEQMEEEVRNAVFGNVGTTIAFRVGPLDAEVLEAIFTPKFLAPDIVNLGFAQIYLSLMIDGIGSQPFSATTLAPIKRPDISCKDMVIHSSRKQFSHPRAQVENAIMQWHALLEKKPKDTGTGERVPEKKYTHKGPEQFKQSDIPRMAEKQKNAVAPSLGEKPAMRQVSVDTSRAPYGQTLAPQKRAEKKSEGQTRSGAQTPLHPQPHVDQSTSGQKTVRAEKSVAELRAILAQISSTSKPAAPEKKNTEGMEENQTAPHAFPTALKEGMQAQAGTLAEKEKEILSVSVDTPKSPSLKDTLMHLVTDVSDTQDSKPVTPSEVAHHDVQTILVQKNSVPPHVAGDTKEDILSPKKLERMMRVNLGDKSPFA
jgi:hypothetical protein